MFLLIKDGFKKRVGLHRSTGMKITDKGHFQTPIDFSGVLIVEGEKLNAVLRDMEPPTHDKWDPKLYKKNPLYAKRLIASLNKWMNECARNLLKNQPEKNIQIKGIEELLPDLSDEQPKVIELKKEALKDRVSTISSRKKRRRRTPLSKSLQGNDIPGNTSGGKVGGTQGKKGKKSALKGKKAKISRLNAYCTNVDEQIYSIIISPKTKGEVTFIVNAIGENGKTSSVKINTATLNEEKVNINKNIIGPIELSSLQPIKLDIKIETSNRLALEVDTK